MILRHPKRERRSQWLDAVESSRVASCKDLAHSTVAPGVRQDLVAGLYLDYRRHRRVRRYECIRSYAEVAETTTAVEILWIPSLTPRHDRDTFLRTDPSADPATSAPIKMKQMSSPVPLLHRISLLRKPQRVRSMKEMTNPC